MNDFSLVEKLEILVNIIVSSPLFLFCCMIGISLLILYIICIKRNWRINKWIFISLWIILGIILIINYNNVFLYIIDNLFDSIFKILYFPSLSTYITIVCLSNFIFFYTLSNKKIKSKNRIINFTSVLIINILLVLIIDIVKKNDINVYDQINIYTNSNLLVLLELTSAVFVSWILIVLFVSAHSKFKKYDNKELPVMPEIIFDDI